MNYCTFKSLVKSLYDWLLTKCPDPYTGSLTLSAGNHTIQVPLPSQPATVYLAATSNGSNACGTGSVDLLGAVPTATGFTLSASISSNSVTVEYMAIQESNS